MRDMVVAVMGGTGFIGSHVVGHLCAAGAQVRVPCRNTDRALFLKPLGQVGQVAPLACDLSDDASLETVLSGVDAVVNLIGILHEHRAGDFQRLHAELPARIARAAPRSARLIQVSAIGADPQSKSIYARTKGEGEAALRAVRPDAVILRPSVVFGPGDQFLNRFAKMAVNSPVLPAIGGGHTRFQPVFVVDVAQAVLAALTRPDVLGHTYELGGPAVMSFREILDWLQKVLGRNRYVMNLPFSVADTQARFLQILPTPPLTRDQVLQLRSDNVVAADALGLRDLGVEPTPMRVAAPPYLQQFVRTQVRKL
ncbi:complex I NDUFA9 subunit family protein [Geminicoccus roseus]|uniref:complex I NDUFA9 subunit family protein n=1 Tax=Geminicoccus roseus TaxID=404900 RepID=UPI000486ED45|nr:complex I NDUFA9 subunit family protein [Geminicoccus roseus]